MKLLSLLLLALMCPGLSAQDYRTFTTSDGASSMRAALLDVERDKTGALVAVLRREADGVVFRVRVERFSAADVQYVNAAEELLIVPAVLRGRLTPAAREVLRKKYGCAAADNEAAVERALLWLSQNQNHAGSWGKNHTAGMTGLALCAFAGHGHGPGSKPHGEVIVRGITWLLEAIQKNKKPFDGICSEKPGVISSAYEHGICTQALAEMYALSNRGKNAPQGLAAAVEKAESVILLSQSPYGAWGYKDGIGYDPYGGRDLSVTGWQVHAICACRDAGFKNDRRAAVLQKAAKYLVSKQTGDGGYGNPDLNSHYNQRNLTGSALSALQFSVQDAIKLGRGVGWLADFTKKEPLSWTKDCSLYAWYFNSLALHRAGGESWKTWNSQCEPLMLANQNPDGSWKVEGVGEVGAGGTGAAAEDKDIYRTCLAALILETPCRFLRPEAKK